MCLLYSAVASYGGERKKVDIVYFRNGDKITCEIKSLSQGKLLISADYTASSFDVDWTKVARIESPQQFVITDPNGTYYVGTLTGDATNRTVSVITPTKVTLKQDQVIEIAELGGSFIKRLSGDISVGLSLAQSNSQKTLATSSNIKYQDQKRIFTLNSSTQFASQQETTNTNEISVKSSLFRQIKESNWFAGGLANFLSSSEQQIALQSTYGGAVARRLIFTNKTNLTALGGLGYTNTRPASGYVSTGPRNELDSAFAVQFSTFRFDSTTFNTNFWIYPSLSDPGHIRFTLNQDLYYKIYGNLYISVSFFDNYDDRPPVGAPVNNTGGSTQIGWSFP
jgi:hypothetical protein